MPAVVLSVPHSSFRHLRPALVCLLSLIALPLQAAPSVVADIPPVHSLAAAVMGNLGEPRLLFRADDSPHGAALRPSAAAALQSADLVVWTGAALTPPLARLIDSLGTSTTSLELLAAPGTRTWPARHAHGHDAGIDAHAWLDPDNAIAWTQAIARTLATLDPDNAANYRTNAAVTIEQLHVVARTLEHAFAPFGQRPFLVAHDSLQYLERRFGLSAGDSIAFGDAAAPGPATLEAARQRVESGDVDCVLAEAGEDARYVGLVTEGSTARIVTIDPRGIEAPPGASLYPALLLRLGDDLVQCLSARQ